VKRAALLLLVMVAGCSTPRIEKLPPPQSIYRPPTPIPTQADFILIDKSDRTLTLFSRGVPFKSYLGLQMGGDPIGPKHFEGDERTPEGRYMIDYRNPRSAYHLSLHNSYPAAADRAYAAGNGRSAGGEIFIHGQPNAFGEGRVPGDWTDGCIAVANAEIEQLWQLVPDGTPIEIRP
jgi:murein L,D-transpeptidase YafK